MFWRTLEDLGFLKCVREDYEDVLLERQRNEKKAHIAGPPKLIECLKQQGFPGGLVVS